MELFVAPHIALPLNKSGEANRMPLLNLFWLVQQVDEAKDASMEIARVDESVGDFNIRVPILRNKRALTKGESLKRARIVESDAKPTHVKKQRK